MKIYKIQKTIVVGSWRYIGNIDNVTKITVKYHLHTVRKIRSHLRMSNWRP